MIPNRRQPLDSMDRKVKGSEEEEEGVEMVRLKSWASLGNSTGVRLWVNQRAAGRLQNKRYLALRTA